MNPDSHAIQLGSTKNRSPLERGRKKELGKSSIDRVQWSTTVVFQIGMNLVEAN